MGKIASIYEFVSTFAPASPNLTQIGLALEHTSDLIETYCDRKFEIANYQEWHRINNPIFVNQWPVNRIKGCSGAINVATIQYTPANASRATYSFDGTRFYLDWATSAGVEGSDEIIVANFPTLALLKAEIETNTGWSFTILSTDYTGRLSKYLKPVTTADANTVNSIAQMDTTNIDAIMYPIGNRSLYLANAVVLSDFGQSLTDLYVQYNAGLFADIGYSVTDICVLYNAGYTYPVDNVAHTALTTAGNVPNALKLICMQMCGDLMKLIDSTTDTGSTGIYKSETIKDYTYNRFDNDNMAAIYAKYSTQLNKFRKFAV